MVNVQVADAPKAFELGNDDIPPDRGNDTAPLRCQFDGCQNAVTKPARGRTPKFCDEHRGTVNKGAKSPGWAKASQVEQVLCKYFDAVGMAISLVNPADGRVIAKGSDAVAHEIVELARSDTKLRKYLEKLTAPGKYGPLMLACAPIIFGIAANHNLLPQFSVDGLTPQHETARGGSAL